MNAQRIKRYATDPVAFREDLIIPSAHGPSRFGEVIADFQREDFVALDQAFLALKEGRKPDLSRLWIERTKGASKDSDLAVALLWLLAFCPRPLSCQVGAADRDQADEMRKAAKDILRLNSWLEEVIEVQSWSIVNERTGSVCEIIPADVAGSHGARPDLLIVNELSHVTRQEFVQNLMDNATKVPHGVVIICTNSGHLGTWQHDWKENARTSERWYYSAFQQPAPWLDPDELEEAKKRNSPNRFARLWFGQWVPAEGDAIQVGFIDRAVDPSWQPLRSCLSGHVFVAGIDLGLKRDNAAVCVLAKSAGWMEEQPVKHDQQPLPSAIEGALDAGLMDDPRSTVEDWDSVWHEGDGKLRLAFTRVWRPTQGQINLQSVEDCVAELHAQLGLSLALFDVWQAGQMIQRLHAQGIEAEGLHFTGNVLTEMASEVVTGFQDNRIVLYEDAELIKDLKRAQLIERPQGSRLEWSRTSEGHGDLGTAFGIATVAARRVNSVPRVQHVQRELVMYPN